MAEPHYADDSVTLHHGDCLDVLRGVSDASVDSVCTDPPYGIGFMGKAWDADFAAADMPMRRNGAQDAVNAGASRQGGRQRAGVDYQRRMARDSRDFGAWCEQWAAECLRVLKPGGHLLAFGGTRTWHRLTCAVEDAGFEIRDSIAWLYGSGFPKSLDVSKAIDKAAGATREVVGTKLGQPGYSMTDGNGDHRTYSEGLGNTGSGAAECAVTAPATDDARTWQGWGTALKPAFEPIVVARKPLSGTVAANVLEHGTGALNIDGCRVGSETRPVMVRTETTVAASSMSGESTGATSSGEMTTAGRWPANVVLDESQAAELDRQSGTRSGFSGGGTNGAGFRDEYVGGERPDTDLPAQTYNDTGGASRFFPVFEDDKAARIEALRNWRNPQYGSPLPETFHYVAKAPTAERPRDGATAHPTVKPLDLMRWLVRLVTPPGGVVLDPFAGSGTTAEACVIEGFRCIAVEREADYLPLIVARLTKPIQPDMFGGVA